MQRKVTLKDIAKQLNLSISTISKSLHDCPEISLPTRELVKNAARLSNYSPNRLAQGLKGNKTKTLGVIVPEVLSYFFAKAIHGIEKTASELGYNIFICLSNESYGKEAESLKSLINGNVDGVILSLARETQSLDNYEHFNDAIRYDVPVVLFDRTTGRLECDKVSIDDYAAAKEATNYFIETGCRNIAFLSLIHGTSVGEKRNLGYQEAIHKANMQDLTINIIDYTTFEHSLLNALGNGDIDAILAADELSAVSVMKYALKHNFKIPQELSVIGFTNGLLGENFVPSLTTVEQHAQEQGAMAAALLIDRIEKKIPEKPVQNQLQTSIIERESTLPNWRNTHK